MFLGYGVSLEYRHENNTRSDLLFRGEDLGGTVRGIEVQLRPQTRERIEERHARYVEGAEAVQWVAHDERPFMPGVMQVKLSPTGDALELVEASPDPFSHQGRSAIRAPLITVEDRPGSSSRGRDGLPHVCSARGPAGRGCQTAGRGRPPEA